MPQLTSDRPITDVTGNPVETYLRIRSHNDAPFNFATIRIVNGRIAGTVTIDPGLYDVAWGRGRWEDILIVHPIYSHVWDVPDINAIELIDLQQSAIANGVNGWTPDFLTVDVGARTINRSLPKPKKRIRRSTNPDPTPTPVGTTVLLVDDDTALLVDDDTALLI